MVGDELWAIVEPLIPKMPRRYKYPGRKRIPDRQVLTGILFVSPDGDPVGGTLLWHPIGHAVKHLDLQL